MNLRSSSFLINFKVFIFLGTILISGPDIYSQLIVNAGEDIEICPGESYQIGGNPTVTGGSGDYTFSWLPEFEINNAQSSNPVVTITMSRLYRVTVFDNINGFVGTDSIYVNVPDLPQIEAGTNQNICLTGSLISVSLSGDVTGNYTTFQWSTMGDGFFPPGDTILDSSYTLGDNDINTGTVNILLTANHTFNCEAVTDTTIIYLLPDIQVLAGQDTVICNYVSEIKLNGTVNGLTNTGIWNSSGNGEFVPGRYTLQAVYIPSETDFEKDKIDISLTSTDNKGCPAKSNRFQVFFIDPPFISAGNDTAVNTKTVPLNGEYINITNVKWSTSGTGSFFPSDDTGQTNYNFSPAEILTGENVMIIFSSVDISDCPVAADTIYLQNLQKMIPNAFTPDNDGYNDIFLKGENIEVYNRWGQLLYKGNQGWDGTYKNRKVPSGTYFYIIHFLKKGERSIYKGTVSIYETK